MSTNVNPQGQDLSKDDADAQWAASLAQSAPVLDAVAKNLVGDVADQPFVDDDTW